MRLKLSGKQLHRIAKNIKGQEWEDASQDNTSLEDLRNTINDIVDTLSAIPDEVLTELGTKLLTDAYLPLAECSDKLFNHPEEILRSEK